MTMPAGVVTPNMLHLLLPLWGAISFAFYPRALPWSDGFIPLQGSPFGFGDTNIKYLCDFIQF